MRLPILVLVLLSGSVSNAAREILKNPGFENGVTDWASDGFSMQTSTEQVHEGRVSVKCTGRTATWQGPGQNIQVTKGKQYLFQSYIKIINDINGHFFQTAMVKIAFALTNGQTNYFSVCIRPFISTADGWTLMGGDFTAPNQEWTSAKLYLEGLLPNTDFFFDDASLTELTPDANWEQKADQRIEQLRKSNLHVNVNLDPGFDPKDVTVQINHLKHLFGWGSMVRSDFMIDPDYSQYQKVVYEMFNWATIQDYKWRRNRGNRTHPDYTSAVKATDVLLNHGLQVRGHCMFWAVDGNNPYYTESLSGQELKQEVDKQIAYMTGISKNKLSHWDVNNELVHGRFFEQHTGDPRYTEHMFRNIHNADPSAQLFLNEYNVVAQGIVTQAYLTQIEQFKAANVNLGGVGVQSHFGDHQEPDPTTISARLDLLAQPGLPIWVTELDMAAYDENKQADWTERVLRLYFAHPAVEGVIYWGFWDHDMDAAKALVHGYTFSLNESGKRFMQLTKETWSTHVNQSLASGTSFSIRGFHGDYEAVVWYQGKPIKRQTFTLGKTDKHLNIHVDGDGQAIQLPPKTNPFNTAAPTNGETTQFGLHTEGHASSTSSSPALSCVTRRSGVSQVGDDKPADVMCQGDEILTGCSSISKNNDWHRDGEQMTMSNGKPACHAINGYLSTAGVQAVARCCSMRGLQCDYRSAGPSGIGMDDRVEVPCAGQSRPLGCSTSTYQTNSDGSLFTKSSCISQNDDPHGGVYAHAACCQGPNLQCQTVTSATSGLNQAAQIGVQCPQGYVMTGCNVFSQYGRAAGAYIASVSGTDICFGVNGSDKFGAETGVQAQATCCRV